MAVVFGLGGLELADAVSQQLDWEVVEQPVAKITAMESETRIILFMG